MSYRTAPTAERAVCCAFVNGLQESTPQCTSISSMSPCWPSLQHHTTTDTNNITHSPLRLHRWRFEHTLRLLVSLFACLLACLLVRMAPPRAYVSLFPNSVLDVDLWRRFYNDEEITADVPPPVKASPTMAGSTSSVSLSVSDQQQAVSLTGQSHSLLF